MWRNGDLRPLPEGVIRGQGFLAKHIQGRPGDMAVFDGFDQVLFHQVFSPAHVDHHGIGHELAEVLMIEDVPGFVGQWKSVHQNPG